MAFSHVQGVTASASASASNFTLTNGNSGLVTLGTGNAAKVVVQYSTNTGSAIALATVAFKDQSGTAIPLIEAGTGTFNAGLDTGTHVCYLYNLAASITQVEVFMASACNQGITMVLDEYSGLTTTGAFNGSPGEASTNTTATTVANNISSGTITPAAQPAIIFAEASDDTRSNHAPSVGTGFTLRTSWLHPFTGAPGGITMDMRITSTSAVGATATNTGTTGDVCPIIMLSVAEAAGGAVVSNGSMMTLGVGI